MTEPDTTEGPLWIGDAVRDELRRRDVDPGDLTRARLLDVGVVVLGRDYVEARWQERMALVALRRMVQEMPDADDEDPRDGDPASWMLPVPLLAADERVQKFDRARLRRRGLGRQFAEVLATWREHRDRATATADTATAEGGAQA